MIRDSLQQIVASAVARLVDSGQLPAAVRDVRVEISDTKQPEHGDYACNFAMVASKPAGMNPRQIGELLAGALVDPAVKSVEVAGPGFLNFRLDPAWLASFVPQVLEMGESLARANHSADCKKINVEFVSVNPNGPITIGSGRGAAYGSALCNVLEAAGNQVHREYYINDGVNSEQMRLFAQALLAYLEHLSGQPFPEELHYKGDFVEEIARDLPGAYSERSLALELARAIGIDARELDRGTGVGQAYRTFYSALNWYDPLILTLSLDDSISPNKIIPLAWSVLFSCFEVLENSYYIIEDYDSDDEPIYAELNEVAAYYMACTIALFAQVDPSININNLKSPQSFSDQYYQLYWQSRDWFKKQRFNRISGDLPPLLDDVIFHEGALHAALEDSYLLIAGGEYRTFNLTSLRQQGQERMIAAQRSALQSFGTTFDTWFSEQSLHDSGAVAAEMERLITSEVADDRPIRTKLKLAKGGKIEDVEIEDQAGKADDEDDESSEAPQADAGARNTLWLRSTKFGDDMDRVLRRRDGRLTYIASDVAYHKDKLTDESGTRGTGPVDKMITILGPDHHGYIGRLQAVVAAMLKADGLINEPVGGEADTFTEFDSKLYGSAKDRDGCRAALSEAKNRLEVQIYQLVRFMKDGKPAPMRKRDGNIYALIDLLREIGEKVKPTGTEEEKLTAGKDVARFFYLMRSHDTTFDFDLDLAEKQSDENPVFYVQYAHARICSVISKAAEQGLTAESDTLDPSLLSEKQELELIKKICDLPFEVRRCAEDYGVHRLTTYAIELARTYHHFYDACRVIQVDQPELSKARLALCQATRNALKATLDLLGVSAPTRMDRASD